MKILLTVLFCVYIYGLQAQTTNNIKEVKELNIYGENSKISIGTVIINQSLKGKVILNASIQFIDTAGIYGEKGWYITRFLFRNPEGISFFGVNMELHFDKPVEYALRSSDGASYENSTLNEPKTIFKYQADQIVPPEFILTVMSKGKIFTKIYGIDGINP